MPDPFTTALPVLALDARTAPLVVSAQMAARLPATVPAPLPPAAPDGAAAPDAVSAWLMRLHAVCAGRATAEEAAARVALVAPMIAGRFPLDAFSRRALEHVAAQCRFWPAYAELVEHLSAWWRANRPHVPVLVLAPPAGPDAEPPLTPEQRAHMAAQLGQLAADIAERARLREAGARNGGAALPDVSRDAFAARRVERAQRREELVAQRAAEVADPRVTQSEGAQA